MNYSLLEIALAQGVPLARNLLSDLDILDEHA